MYMVSMCFIAYNIKRYDETSKLNLGQVVLC